MTETADTGATQFSDVKPPVGVWPTFRYRDAKAAIDFLTTVLGFESTAVHTDADYSHQVSQAELRWPLGGGIMLGSERESADWPSSPGQDSTYVVTDAPDTLYARVIRAGVTVTQELTEQDLRQP